MYEEAFCILYALDTTVLALQKVRVSHVCVVVVAAGKQHTEAGRQVCGAPLEQLTEGKNISATQFSLGEQSST